MEKKENGLDSTVKKYIFMMKILLEKNKGGGMWRISS